MELQIYDTEHKLVDIVDTAVSIIWANRYRQSGDFELQVANTAKMAALLQEDFYVKRKDDKMTGIIESIFTEQDEENGDYMIVKGRCTKSILTRRIVWEQTQLNGTVENGLRRLVTDAFISPAIPERKIDNFVLAAAHGYTETLNTQYTGQEVKEAVEEICAANGYGYDVILENGQFTCDFYKGIDRSKAQTAVPQIVFSEKLDNLQGTEYQKDKTNYKSVALVAGEGEGSARRTITVQRSKDLSGLNRREMFIDARDISSNEGEISETEYNAQLQARGVPELAAATLIESMAGSVYNSAYAYKTDYNLGDIVTVISKSGVEATAQVLEVVETWDSNGYTCTPTFG